MKELLPISIEAIKQSAEENREHLQNIQAVILSVGFSSEPLILDIIAMKQPSHVCFIHAKESEKVINAIVGVVNLKPSNYTKFLADKDDTRGLYLQFKRALAFLKDDQSIACNQ